MVDIRVQRKTVNLLIIFIWKEVYVVGQVDANSSDESNHFESDNVKQRDRREYIDLISNPAHFLRFMSPNSLENGVGDQSNRNHIPVSALVPDRDAIFYDQNRALIQISECDLSVFHSNINHIIKMKDAISSPRSICLEICTAF